MEDGEEVSQSEDMRQTLARRLGRRRKYNSYGMRAPCVVAGLRESRAKGKKRGGRGGEKADEGAHDHVPALQRLPAKAAH